jgi:hypothetical protein
MQEDTMTSMSSAPDFLGAVFLFGFIAVFFLCLIAPMWRVFTKAGKPGWASLIPIYNTVVLLEITGRPTWWFILFLIPFVNIIVSIVLCFDLAAAFNKSTMFGLGILLLGFIFLPLLAFGDAEYQGRSPTYA